MIVKSPCNIKRMAKFSLKFWKLRHIHKFSYILRCSDRQIVWMWMLLILKGRSFDDHYSWASNLHTLYLIWFTCVLSTLKYQTLNDIKYWREDFTLDYPAGQRSCLETTSREITFTYNGKLSFVCLRLTEFNQVYVNCWLISISQN